MALSDCISIIHLCSINWLHSHHSSLWHWLTAFALFIFVALIDCIFFIHFYQIMTVDCCVSIIHLDKIMTEACCFSIIHLYQIMTVTRCVSIIHLYQIMTVACCIFVIYVYQIMTVTCCVSKQNLVSSAETIPNRIEELRKYAAIYGRFDSKRKNDRPMSLHEVRHKKCSLFCICSMYFSVCEQGQLII